MQATPNPTKINVNLLEEEEAFVRTTRLVGERLIALKLPVLDDEDVAAIRAAASPVDLLAELDSMISYNCEYKDGGWYCREIIEACVVVLTQIDREYSYVERRFTSLFRRLEHIYKLGFSWCQEGWRHIWTSDPTDEVRAIDATVFLDFDGESWSYEIFVDGKELAERGKGCTGSVTPVGGEGRFDDPVDCAEEAFGYLRQSLESLLDELPL